MRLISDSLFRRKLTAALVCNVTVLVFACLAAVLIDASNRDSAPQLFPGEAAIVVGVLIVGPLISILVSRAIARDVSRRCQQDDKRLRELDRELAETIGKAAQAEVATNILHNVGNLLNNVNIGVTKTQELVHAFRLGGAERAVELLEQHQEDLPTFFANDERAHRLPAYLSKLVKQLRGEQQAALTHLESITDAVQHVKQIIQAQQTFAVGALSVEACDLAELLEEAILLSGLSYERHGIEVRRDYADVAPIQVEKGKLLQILVNLISNAKDSLKASQHGTRRLTLAIRRCHGDVEIEVADNGVGIEPGNLSRVFARGFTTKTDGHGFGLHSAVNAIAEMGGRLSAASDGVAQGARFVVRLPEELVTTEACCT